MSERETASSQTNELTLAQVLLNGAFAFTSLTLSCIAEHAEVSETTVSRALRGSKLVKSSTRNRIEDIVFAEVGLDPEAVHSLGDLSLKEAVSKLAGEEYSQEASWILIEPISQESSTRLFELAVRIGADFPILPALSAFLVLSEEKRTILLNILDEHQSLFPPETSTDLLLEHVDLAAQRDV